MNNSAVKQFFTNLYRDLDERHLLLPAIALLVAIVAVPMLLGSSAEPTTPPAAPALTDADATAVQSAVLVSDPGVRDYTKRLEALKKKNPFVQQFADPEEIATLDETASALSSGTDTGTATTGATSAETGASVPGSGAEAPTNLPPSGGIDTTTDPTVEHPVEPEVTTETKFYAPRVDVTFGPLGDAEQVDGIRYFDFLPDEDTPVVAFLGLGDSSDTAVFAVSNEVTETSGQGTCAPEEVDGCDLLFLKIGQQRLLKVDTVDGDGYGESITYRLKVLDTRFTRVPDPRG